MIMPIIAITKQSGEYILLSLSANFVPFTFLKKPTYLNSPIALMKKMAGIMLLDQLKIQFLGFPGSGLIK